MGDNPGSSGAQPTPRALLNRQPLLALLRGRCDHGSRVTADVTSFDVAGRGPKPRNVSGLWELEEARTQIVP